jgi:hypothetical protein
LDVLRERNRELSTRVQELDLELFQLLAKPLQTKLTNQLQTKQRRHQKSTRNLGLGEPEEDQFEDAKEEASQITTTDSEDKHSNAAEADHEVESHSDSRDLHSQDEEIAHPLYDPSHPSTSPQQHHQQLSSEANLKNLISLYENQFEKMKVDLPYLPISMSLTLPLPRVKSVTSSYL